MNLSENLDLLFQLGASAVVVCIMVYVLASRRSSRKRRRTYRGGSSAVGNALQQLQAIARPSIEYQLEEKLKEKEVEDDEGGPDDPGTYYRRLRERIDQQRRADSEETPEI